MRLDAYATLSPWCPNLLPTLIKLADHSSAQCTCKDLPTLLDKLPNPIAWMLTAHSTCCLRSLPTIMHKIMMLSAHATFWPQFSLTTLPMLPNAHNDQRMIDGSTNEQCKRVPRTGTRTDTRKSNRKANKQARDQHNLTPHHENDNSTKKSETHARA